MIEWQEVDETTGEIRDIRIDPDAQRAVGVVHRGYERPRTVRDVHRILTHDAVIDRGGDRMRYGGTTDGMRRDLLRRAMGGPQSGEDRAPTGYAADWFTAVLGGMYSNTQWLDGGSGLVPPSGVHVARQLARLAGNGDAVTIPERSLADAVGRTDAAGRHIAYTQGGIEALIRHGFLAKIVTGRGRGARTTYRLVRPRFGIAQEVEASPSE
ncbi:hypothetical protein [Nocardioides panacisoli]|uniref:Uncharacterized protein n=1 Tax=Nocardioides panacisoli TaxID=627624 RepID=A0ABP7IGJ7_9ACTN